MLTDEHWSKLRKILREEGAYDEPALRRMVEGALYRLRTGCPWRDLPEYFGRWNSIYKKFNAWPASGKWLNIFKKLIIVPDLEWVSAPRTPFYREQPRFNKLLLT